VKLNRPAYLYVLWVDTEGKVGPVYPWVKGDWGRRREERPRDELSLPEEDAGGVYPVDPGEPGMETLLLLAREAPLPADVDLAKVLAGLGKQDRRNQDELGEVAWFENGMLVKDDPDRAANLKEISPASNPVLRLQGELKRRLGGQFAYTRAVTFGNLGGR